MNFNALTRRSLLSTLGASATCSAAILVPAKNRIQVSGTQFVDDGCKLIVIKAHEPGKGRSSLANRLAQQYSQGGKLNVTYYRAEKFKNEMVYSKRYYKMHEFHASTRGPDILIIDDIEDIAHQEYSAAEMVHCIKERLLANRLTIVTRLYPEGKELDRRLASLLGRGRTMKV